MGGAAITPVLIPMLAAIDPGDGRDDKKPLPAVAAAPEGGPPPPPPPPYPVDRVDPVDGVSSRWRQLHPANETLVPAIPLAELRRLRARSELVSPSLLPFFEWAEEVGAAAVEWEVDAMALFSLVWHRFEQSPAAHSLTVADYNLTDGDTVTLLLRLAGGAPRKRASRPRQPKEPEAEGSTAVVGARQIADNVHALLVAQVGLAEEGDDDGSEEDIAAWLAKDDPAPVKNAAGAASQSMSPVASGADDHPNPAAELQAALRAKAAAEGAADAARARGRCAADAFAAAART